MMGWWQSLRNLVTTLTRPIIQRVFMSTRQAGVLVTEDTALTFGAVWACVSVISRTIAALPWQVYERSSQGRKLIDGQIGWLLNNAPNPEMTAFTFRETLMAHVLTWGNGYAEIQRDGAGRPVALWPLMPDRMLVRRDENTAEIVYHYSGEYGTSDLAPSDVLHVHGLGFDGLVGYSPVRMAARSIGLGMAQEVFGESFYANGMVHGALIEMPGNMSKEQIEAAERYHNDKGAGPAKAFSTKVAPKGTTVHSMSMPMTDAQFIESRRLSVTDIARWYGVPPHKIADLDRSTNNNIEHQGIEFVTDAIVPWVVRLEQEANSKLIGYRAQGRVYTKILVNALMRGDSAARGEFYRTMITIGAMSINEVRELEDMNDIGPDGDQHLVQINQTTLEWLVDNPGAKSSASSSPAAKEDAPSNVVSLVDRIIEKYRKQA